MSRIPEATESSAQEGADALRAMLSGAGLTADEVRTFMVAWQFELFGREPGADLPQRGRPPADLRPKADVLVYLVPPAALDPLVRLSFEPEPSEVRRAMIVRVDLGEPGAPDQYEAPPTHDQHHRPR